jgi:hypothetical protein
MKCKSQRDGPVAQPRQGLYPKFSYIVISIKLSFSAQKMGKRAAANKPTQAPAKTKQTTLSFATTSGRTSTRAAAGRARGKMADTVSHDPFLAYWHLSPSFHTARLTWKAIDSHSPDNDIMCSFESNGSPKQGHQLLQYDTEYLRTSTGKCSCNSKFGVSHAAEHTFRDCNQFVTCTR